MGKYTEQAGSYNQGIKMVETTLKNVLEELKDIKLEDKTTGKLDTLGSNTTESINLIIESINNLLTTISSNKLKLMNKGIEIDKRIADEEASEKQVESSGETEQTPTLELADLNNKLRKFNKTSIK